MQNVYDLVDVGQLTAFIRTLLFPDLILNQWLPNVSVDRTHYRYVLNDRLQRPAAKFISYDAEAPIAGRRGLSTKMGELPPIKEKSVLTESDQVLIENLNAYNVLSDPMMASIFNDAAERTRSILQRLEIAKGEALSKGQVTINDGGLLLPPITFGVPSAQMNVAPTTVWSDIVNSTPITDMVGWRDSMLFTTGFRPEVTLTSSIVVGYLQTNKQIVGAYGTNRTRINRDELNELLVSEGLPPINADTTPFASTGNVRGTYDAMYKDTSGTLRRSIDANRFVWLPANGQGFGQTQFGRTREAIELGGNGVNLADIGGAPGLVAVTMKSFDPVELWTKAAAIALPVIETPDQMFSAVVY